MHKLSIAIPCARPPWTRLGKRLESLCRKALHEFALLEGVEKLAIALSGGKDSLGLLFLLKAILGHGFPPIELIAIHVTGPNSCGAGVGTGLLHAMCRAIDVPLIVCQDTSPAHLDCYPCSRKRRALLFDAAKKHGAKAIAFGHHRDDSIQTLLLNLLHKGEFAAMLPKVPMHKFGVRVIRPLIYASSDELAQFAKLYGFARTVCACPVGQTSHRKKVGALLDALEAVFPNARGNLSLASLRYGSKKAAVSI